MSRLPEIQSFEDALQCVGAINMLQSELITLRSPLSDLELIITHANKYSNHAMFVPIKLEFLQRASTLNVDPPPSFDNPPPAPSEYCAAVARNARDYTNSSTTSTVLQAFVEEI